MIRIGAAGVALALLVTGSARAQAAEDELDRLRARLDAQQRRIEALESQLQQAPPVRADALADTPAHVSLGAFPGSLRVPGTELSIRLSGYVKLDAIVDFDPIGSEELFAPSTIPTGGEAGFDTRTRLHALQSQFGIDVRQDDTPYGPFRALVEGDFFGSGGDQSTSNSAGFRLRQAYGELGRLLAGQTWSTFMDLQALPELLDFQGPNGQSFVRQPQLRYTQPLAGGLTLAAAVENPEGDLFDRSAATATDVAADEVPDLIVRLHWEHGRGHLQTGALWRRLTVADAAIDDETDGWGVNLSGLLRVSDVARHNLVFQLNGGEGIGRYVLDLAGGAADVWLAGGRIRTRPALGGYLGYQHWWSDRLRSTLVYGHVEVDVAESQPVETLERTRYAAVNLIWSPLPRTNVGIEYLHGRREDRGGADGSANRLQLSSQFLF